MSARLRPSCSNRRCLPTQLTGTVEEDESLERLLIQLLCNLSGFKNNQLKLGEWVYGSVNRSHDRQNSMESTGMPFLRPCLCLSPCLHPWRSRTPVCPAVSFVASRGLCGTLSYSCRHPGSPLLRLSSFAVALPCSSERTWATPKSPTVTSAQNPTVPTFASGPNGRSGP